MILIHTHDNHFKFWSAEKLNGRYTGKIKFGKIGTLGNPHYYDSESKIETLIREKYNKGYELYKDDSPTSTPSNVENPIEEMQRLRRNGQIR